MMEIDLSPIAGLLPWLPVAGGVLGVLMRQLRTGMTVTGFTLLGVTTLAASAVVGSLGLALGWDKAQWLGAPLGILLLIALSNQTDSLVSHTVETVKAKKSGDP